MTIKKSLLAAATVTTVAIAGTGIATAQSSELPGSSSTTTFKDSKDETDDTDEDDTDLLGSIEGSTEVLGIFNDFGDAVSGSISILPNIYDAVQDFQDMIDDFPGNLPLPTFP
ncbi:MULTISPECIES: hypothetical protein [Actinomycetes]|uniref:hypothetical protein n=1 Tax=Actinomycetes TaxID=1760 RepID=UPI003F8F4171